MTCPGRGAAVPRVSLEDRGQPGEALATRFGQRGRPRRLLLRAQSEILRNARGAGGAVSGQTVMSSVSPVPMLAPAAVVATLVPLLKAVPPLII